MATFTATVFDPSVFDTDGQAFIQEAGNSIPSAETFETPTTTFEFSASIVDGVASSEAFGPLVLEAPPGVLTQESGNSIVSAEAFGRPQFAPTGQSVAYGYVAQGEIPIPCVSWSSLPVQCPSVECA